MAVISLRMKQGVFQLMILSLNLLQADEIGVLCSKPLKKTLAGSRTYAIDVEGDDAHISSGMGALFLVGLGTRPGGEALFIHFR